MWPSGGWRTQMNCMFASVVVLKSHPQVCLQTSHNLFNKKKDKWHIKTKQTVVGHVILPA